NRNADRERKGGEPRRYDSEEEKRYTSDRHERQREFARANAERTIRMSSDRENDLYERQSI
ncbi:MAG TPA: hypothetical protein VFS22_00755, partial [Flavisolibacter sp.]|nr:hypothetical protein [Flavisolibacter sp.]